MIAITVSPVDVIHAGPLLNNRQMSSCNYYITMYHSCQQDSENIQDIRIKKHPSSYATAAFAVVA